MNKSLLRTFLLILLSITLPLQAAVAASKGGCLRHTQDQQGPASAAGVAGQGHRPIHGHSDKANPNAGRDRTHFNSPTGNHHGGHRASLEGGAGPASQAAVPGVVPADPSAHASTVGDTACPHHQAADAPAASPEPGCNSCGWCCMGTALPSPSLRWPASLAQLAPTPTVAWAHVSPPLRALERPPRAPLSAT